MDYSRIPYFATFRQTGTVIVRVSMELSNNICKPEACPTSDCPPSNRRPSACQKCLRTRSRTYFSDCDSEKVKVRQYRASSARSKYVNVCAAVCLVLLVGDILPLTTGAPQKRTMARERRSTEENKLWGNPCDYSSNFKPAKYTKKLAADVANQARSAYKSTSSYKDDFALKLHSYKNFEELLPTWSNMNWLRNFTWFKGVLPEEKVINFEMPEQHLDELMTRIEDVLPLMYKGLKMIVAGLDSISKDGLNEDILTDVSMKQKIAESVQNVRAVLCVFFDYMSSRSLEILPLLDDELQDISKEDKLSYSLLVYRDTLNYLQYLAQVFQKLSDEDSKSN